MRVSWINVGAVAAVVVAAALSCRGMGGHAAHYLLKSPMNPTRELYQHINPRFVANTKKKPISSVGIKQSHAAHRIRRSASPTVKNRRTSSRSDYPGCRSPANKADSRWLEQRLPNRSRPLIQRSSSWCGAGILCHP